MKITNITKTIRAAGIIVAARTVKGGFSWDRCCTVSSAPVMHHPVLEREIMDVDDSRDLRRDDRPRAVQSGSLQSFLSLQGWRLPQRGVDALPQNPTQPQAQQPSGKQGASSTNRSGADRGFGSGLGADHRDHSSPRAAVFSKTGDWANRLKAAAEAFTGLAAAAAAADRLAHLATTGWNRLMRETRLPTPRAQAVLVRTYPGANYRSRIVAAGGSSVST